MAIFYIILASAFTSLSNLFLRKSIGLRAPDGTSSGGDPFLIQRMLGSAAIVFLFMLSQNIAISFEGISSILGISAGIILGLLMWTMSKSLRHGPSGLTLAILNTACLAPPLAMTLLFGEAYGHTFSFTNGGGSLMVIAGLLWMGWDKNSTKWEKGWIPWVIAAFAVNALLLIFFQWRALLLKEGLPPSPLLPFHCDPACSGSFTLLMFLTAAGFQLCLRPNALRRTFPTKTMLFWGGLGGLINGAGILFLIAGADTAASLLEKMILFPLYCVTLICLNNFWAHKLYGERINMPATLLCLTGILFGLL